MNINNKTIVVFGIIFIIIMLLLALIIINQSESCKTYIPYQIITKESEQQKKVESMDPIYRNVDNRNFIQTDNMYKPDGYIQNYNPVQSPDIIRDYDFRKVYDPFEQPARRIARHEIHPLHLKRLIDIPTRGYPDNFTQFGTLVKEHKHKHHSDENKILRLFGRQEFPGSNRYEYYTMINSGLDQIKIPLNIRKQELYDGDSVFIKELDSKYLINLFNFDQPKYYPDIIY